MYSRKPSMFTANDRVIKLWKLDNKRERKYESCKKLLQKGKLILPRSKVIGESVEGDLKSIYKGGHDFHINSISLNSDGETFLTSDDLKINIWNIAY